MKKFLFTFILVLCSICVNASDLERITSDYQKMVNIETVMFHFDDKELDFNSNGVCYIKYKDFGSAGNMLTIRFSIKDWSDGKEIKKEFEDIFILRNDEGTIVILNKYKENILWLIKGESGKYAFYITDKMMLISD